MTGQDDPRDESNDEATPSATASGDGRQVCVTGAAGYIGSHVVRVLLEHGFRVRGTVRDVTDESKTRHLRELVAEPAHPLELVIADLLKPGSYDEAIADCELVCHAAASVRLAAKDPQREIIAPAVEGTKNVLEACQRAGSVRRVVLTSSAAAVTRSDKPADYTMTEADWNDTATLREPYLLAKTKAERWAWDFHKQLSDDERFDLIALHPNYTIGPILARAHLKSSPSIVRDLMRRTFPACPRLFFNLVDVREVADAHLAALVRPNASGRYLLSHRGLWMREMAQRLAPRFPDYPVPTGHLPNLVMYAASLFDKRITVHFLRNNLGKRLRFDGSRAELELGIRYRSVDASLIDTAQSFIDLGAVKPKKH